MHLALPIFALLCKYYKLSSGCDSSTVGDRYGSKYSVICHVVPSFFFERNSGVGNMSRWDNRGVTYCQRLLEN